MTEVTAGEARAQDGCILRYRIHQKPGKPRLVLIHSLALDATIWDGIVDGLGGDVEILTYDCRGHGQSERRAGAYTVQLFAADLVSILDDCKWPSAVVAGCSMGGCVAQAFACDYPGRASGLALIDTTAWYGHSAQEDWSQRAAKAAETGFAAMLPFQLVRWFSDNFRATRAAMLAEMSRVFLANDIACYQGACSLLGSADLRSELGSLRISVSVIVGEEDYATPLAMAETLHELIPVSSLTVIEKGRHLTPVECPEKIAALLAELIGRVRVPRGAPTSFQK
jgi:3-oxoadipate enol-lactonase